MTGDTPQGRTPDCCPAGQEPVEWKPEFRLAESDTPPCGHPDVRPGPPRLWAALTLDRHDGWANLSFHWTGTGWAPCDPVSWAVGPDPANHDLVEGTDRALSAANAVPARTWLNEYRLQLRTDRDQARTRLEWEEARARRDRERIRHLECAIAVVDLTDLDVAAVAHRLLPHWTGSAQDLISTAAALC